MPIFEYRCLACETNFEEFIRSSGQENELRCPVCNGGTVQRKFSIFGFGSGSSSPAEATSSSTSSCSSCSSRNCSTCR